MKTGPLSLICALLACVSACDKLPGQKASQEAAAGRGMPDFGGVEIVEVEAEGVGPTRNAAILDALNLAVQKTNGTPIAGVTENDNGSLAISNDSKEFGVTLSNVASITRGAVKGFEILSEGQHGKAWEVTVKAKVAKFKDTAASAMPKVAIAPVRSSSQTFQIGEETLSTRDASNGVRQAVSASIGRSNRFFVIDRTFDDTLEAEVANTVSGNTDPTELAKLGHRLTADILILPEIRRLEYRKSSRTLRFSGRELRSYAGGAQITFNVLNVSTGQLILTKTYTSQFPETPPTVLGTQNVRTDTVVTLLTSLAEQFTREFVARNFPVSIVKMDGGSVTLSQGEGTLQVGETYDVVSLGEEIKDPQTGQSLGRSETPAGVVTITRTAEKYAIGSFRGAFEPASFTPGVLELREASSNGSPPRLPASIPVPANEKKTTSTKPETHQNAARAKQKAEDDFDKGFGF